MVPADRPRFPCASPANDPDGVRGGASGRCRQRSVPPLLRAWLGTVCSGLLICFAPAALGRRPCSETSASKERKKIVLMPLSSCVSTESRLTLQLILDLGRVPSPANRLSCPSSSSAHGNRIQRDDRSSRPAARAGGRALDLAALVRVGLARPLGLDGLGLGLRRLAWLRGWRARGRAKHRRLTGGWPDRLLSAWNAQPVVGRDSQEHAIWG